MEGYIKLFRYYKQLGDKTFDQIMDDSQFFWCPGPRSNSIAVIVQHLNGNMLSRWTDFLTSDGEKETRNRDGEFESKFQGRGDMFLAWEEGWTTLFKALESITDSNKNQIIYIRNRGHSIDQAVQRQLAHYSYHIGQIVYLGRLLVGREWKSLSIPVGQSEKYNAETFAAGKRNEHFADGQNDNSQQ